MAVGPRKAPLPLCDVGTMADVIARCVSDFGATPKVMNVIEPESPTRSELVQKLRESRPGIRVFWLPAWILKGMSGAAIGLQRLIGRKKPLNVYAAFQSEKYDPTTVSQFLKH